VAVARVGSPALAFQLKDLQGNSVDLSDFRGQVVLLNFWTLWCGYCRTEFPVIQDFYERYQSEGFVVLAINIQESQDRVSSFVDEIGLSFPVLLDRRGNVTASYRVSGLPTSFLVDRRGYIVKKHVGPINEAMLDEYMAMVGIQ
jgi:peroxiredoxin